MSEMGWLFDEGEQGSHKREEASDVEENEESSSEEMPFCTDKVLKTEQSAEMMGGRKSLYPKIETAYYHKPITSENLPVNRLGEESDNEEEQTGHEHSANWDNSPENRLNSSCRGSFSEEKQPDSQVYEGFVNIVPEEYSLSETFKWLGLKNIPSAPPLPESYEQSLMEIEPPQWLRDSDSANCMKCWAPFKPLYRGRHHCRLCGGLFCSACSSKRCLLPAKFRVREPQRVCDICYTQLEPLQKALMKKTSNAAQIAVRDVTDWTCLRGWINMPLNSTMEEEIYKATNVLRHYQKVGILKSERALPERVLNEAKGLAILTVANGGILLTCKFGTGLVVVQKKDGSWSAPSAFASFGLGCGPQVGGELNDFIIALYDEKAIKAFCNAIHISVGAGISAALGFLGRFAGTDIRAGMGGTSTCHTYSSSKGAFVGVCLEGSIFSPRTDLNVSFYGDPHIQPSDILCGNVDQPVAAAALYKSLDDLFQNLQAR